MSMHVQNAIKSAIYTTDTAKYFEKNFPHFNGRSIYGGFESDGVNVDVKRD